MTVDNPIMKNRLKILVTGACGVTSRSVVRSLLLSKNFSSSEFIGADIGDNLYGFYEKLYKRVYKVPHVSTQGYRATMEGIIKEENIDAAVVIPELEVVHWSSHPFAIPYLVPPPRFSEAVISKRNLYDMLEGTGLIPAYLIAKRRQIQDPQFSNPFSYPCWIRDFSIGSTSGKGAYMASDSEQLIAWTTINRGTEEFMLSEFLSGRNYTCHLLYNHGTLLKVGIYERLEYFMKNVAISGITGNISRGRLTNDELVKANSIKAVESICEKTRETMHGLVAVDLRADRKGNPLITEINIRHVACTSAFASAGFNLSEYQVLCALNRTAEINGEVEKIYPEANLILRDIDGAPIWIPSFVPIAYGKSR